MTIHKDSKSSIEKFLNRCIVHPKYKIAFYVKDEKSANLLLDEILNYYEKTDGNGITQVTRNGRLGAIIFFKNESIIHFFTAEEPTFTGVHSHLVFMDSRIRETFIRDHFRPCIDKFDLGNENFIINPKLIYIKFLNEEDKDENITEKQ